MSSNGAFSRFGHETQNEPASRSDSNRQIPIPLNRSICFHRFGQIQYNRLSKKCNCFALFSTTRRKMQAFIHESGFVRLYSRGETDPRDL